MTLSELAEVHTIKHIWVVGEDGETDVIYWHDATREKFGEVPVKRIAQNIWESEWQSRQFPQETAVYGLVIII